MKIEKLVVSAMVLFSAAWSSVNATDGAVSPQEEQTAVADECISEPDAGEPVGEARWKGGVFVSVGGGAEFAKKEFGSKKIKIAEKETEFHLDGYSKNRCRPFVAVSLGYDKVLQNGAVVGVFVGSEFYGRNKCTAKGVVEKDNEETGFAKGDTVKASLKNRSFAPHIGLKAGYLSSNGWMPYVMGGVQFGKLTGELSVKDKDGKAKKIAALGGAEIDLKKTASKGVPFVGIGCQKLFGEDGKWGLGASVKLVFPNKKNFTYITETEDNKEVSASGHVKQKTSCAVQAYVVKMF